MQVNINQKANHSILTKIATFIIALGLIAQLILIVKSC